MMNAVVDGMPAHLGQVAGISVSNRPPAFSVACLERMAPGPLARAVIMNGVENGLLRTMVPAYWPVTST